MTISPFTNWPMLRINSNPDILKYDNRKAIELAQTLGRPLTSSEYKKLKISKSASAAVTLPTRKTEG